MKMHFLSQTSRGYTGLIARLPSASLLLIGILMVGQASQAAFAAIGTSGRIQDEESSASSEDESEEDTLPPLTESETFVPDFEDNDLAGAEDRAWEYRPYRVAVWFCLDGSPVLNDMYPQVAREVTARSELLDPSGWDLSTGRCPSKFRAAFMKYLDQPERVDGFPDLRVVEAYDKIMVVCLESESDQTIARVREFDVQTQQWGPVTQKSIVSRRSMASQVMDAIAQSFMPIARIDRVTEVEEKDERGRISRRDEVVMMVRAVKACQRTVWSEKEPEEPDDELTLEAEKDDAEADGEEETESRFQRMVVATDSSPVYVKESDRFLPIIRRTDRKGNLEKLEPLEFTFLTIDRQDQAELRASIQSSFRAPLSQRASRRAEKLALVIRPPNSPTTLRLVSRGDDPEPLEGMEVFSRGPNQQPGDDNENLGLTDWRGEIEIPPSDDGLRLILVKRGSRPLKRIPIIPGLYAEVVTSLPDDETRLYAEGVFRGLENEVLGLVIQREVAIADIEAALKQKSLESANEAYKAYKELPTLSDLKDRLSNAVADLKFMTNDSGERAYIDYNQTMLNNILDKEMTKSKDTAYLEQIQQLTIESRNSNSTSPASEE